MATAVDATPPLSARPSSARRRLADSGLSTAGALTSPLAATGSLSLTAKSTLPSLQVGSRDSSSSTSKAQQQAPQDLSFDSHKERIARLSEKLFALHEGLDHDRTVRMENLQGHMRELDNRVLSAQDTTHKKFALCKEEVEKAQQELDIEWADRDKLQEECDTYTGEVEGKLQALLRAEQANIRETEEKILKAFEDRTSLLKAEVSKCGRTRVENESNLRSFLEVDIPKLYKGLKEEVQHRESMEHRLMDRARSEVTQLKSAIAAEQKAREETEEAMVKMMEDVMAKMYAEIAAERRQREKTEEMLLTLLQQTCDRLQVAAEAAT